MLTFRALACLYTVLVLAYWRANVVLYTDDFRGIMSWIQLEILWLYMKSQRITSIIRIHHAGNMNICTKFHYKNSYSWYTNQRKDLNKWGGDYQNQNQNQLYWPGMCTHTRNLTLVFSCSQCTYTEIDIHTAQNKDNKLDMVNINIKLLCTGINKKYIYPVGPIYSNNLIFNLF